METLSPPPAPQIDVDWVLVDEKELLYNAPGIFVTEKNLLSNAPGVFVTEKEWIIWSPTKTITPSETVCGAITQKGESK
jgi:hypothetical protein